MVLPRWQNDLTGRVMWRIVAARSGMKKAARQGPKPASSGPKTGHQREACQISKIRGPQGAPDIGAIFVIEDQKRA